MHPYWKPELSIRQVQLTDAHPVQPFANYLPTVRLPKPTPAHPSALAYLPPRHVDEIGLTSEKYIHLNNTVNALPLKITFDSNALSAPRWRLLKHFEMGFSSQADMGFQQSDIDDV